MGSGELVLRDGGTHWHNDGILAIGQARFGTVRVENGATVNSGAPHAGDDVNARGYLKLDGAGTRWDSGRITVANLGQGDVTVRNGATAQHQRHGGQTTWPAMALSMCGRAGAVGRVGTLSLAGPAVAG